MKFGQLIEYNMRNIILEKSYTKCGGKTSPRLFPGKLKLSISVIQSKVLCSLFFFVSQIEGYQNILKLGCRPRAFTSYQHFQKINRGLELVSLPHFPHNFLREIFLLLYSTN